MHFGCEQGSRGEALIATFAPSKNVKSKEIDLQPRFTGPISRHHTFRDYVTVLCGCRAPGREPLFHLSEPKMNNPRTNLVNVALSEGHASFTTYFADQEPIDGKLTVVDLTDGTCRWPTGNPRDLNTFRYCGGAAHTGPYCDRHAQLAYLPRLPRAA